MPSIRADASRKGHQDSCYCGTCAVGDRLETSACSCRLCSSGRRGGRFLDIERPIGRGQRGGVGERTHTGDTGDGSPFISGRNKMNRSRVLNLSSLSPLHLQLTDKATRRKEVDDAQSSDDERRNNLNPFRGGPKPRRKKLDYFFHLLISFDDNL